MKLLTFYLLSCIFPSIAIYYFTYGNAPMALKLQAGYFILLLILFTAAVIRFSRSPSSGGRGSNPIGYVGGVISLYLFLLPMVLSVGGISLLYIGTPVSEPGSGHTIIKWGFFALVLGGVSIMGYYYARERYIKAIAYLPAFVRHVIYKRLMSQGKLSYDIHSQLYSNIAKQISQVNQSQDLMIMSQQPYLLREILTDRELSKNETPVIRQNRLYIAKEICKQRNTTDYPGKGGFYDILSRFDEDEFNNPEQIITVLLDCLEPEDLRQVRTMFSKNEEFIRLIWTKYPFMRSHYIHYDADLQIQIIEELLPHEKVLEYKDNIIKYLSYMSEYRKDQIPGYHKLFDYMNSL